MPQKENLIKYAAITHSSVCVQFQQLGGGGLRDEIRKNIIKWKKEMQHTVKEKSINTKTHCTFTDNDYKGQFLGKNTKHVYTKGLPT